MAAFATVKDKRGVEVWLNLDYVVRIERGAGPEGETSIHFADGTVLGVAGDGAKKLFKQVRRAGKKKKKTKRASPDQGPAAAPVT